MIVKAENHNISKEWDSPPAQNHITAQIIPLEIKKEVKQKVGSIMDFIWRAKVIPLAYHKGKLLLKGKEKDSPFCFSTNTLIPFSTLENPPSKRCSCCPYNNPLVKQRNPPNCIHIHTLLALTAKEEVMFSFSLKETKAKDLELLLAAMVLTGGEIYQYQVDLQISFSCQSTLRLKEIKFSNLKKFKKINLNLPSSSFLKGWQPAWLKQVYSKTSNTIAFPVSSNYRKEL